MHRPYENLLYDEIWQPQREKASVENSEKKEALHSARELHAQAQHLAEITTAAYAVGDFFRKVQGVFQDPS